MATPQPDAAQQQDSQRRDAQVIAGLAVVLTGASVAALAPTAVALLTPVGVTAASAKAAVALTQRLAPPGSATGPAARATAATAATYRAAYLLAAARRIDTRLKAGQSLAQAVAAERPFYSQHRAAQQKRAAAAQAVDTASRAHGTVLGWYLGPAKQHTADCEAAAGRNFRADRPPVIGWPGTVHAGCRCRPGPMHAGAGWVDDAVAAVAGRRAAAA